MRQERASAREHPFGTRLRELRHRLGLTQDQLAAEAGLSDRTEIARLENGWNKGTAATTRQKLALGLGLSLDNAFAYFDGHLGLDEALSLSSRRRPSAET